MDKKVDGAIVMVDQFERCLFIGEGKNAMLHIIFKGGGSPKEFANTLAFAVSTDIEKYEGKTSGKWALVATAILVGLASNGKNSDKPGENMKKIAELVDEIS